MNNKFNEIKKNTRLSHFKECKLDVTDITNMVLELCARDYSNIDNFPFYEVMFNDQQKEIYYDIKENERTLSYIENNYDFIRSDDSLDVETVRDMYFDILKDRGSIDIINRYLENVDKTAYKSDLMKDMISEFEHILDLEQYSSSDIDGDFFEDECKEFARATDYLNAVSLPIGICHYDKSHRRFNYPQSLGMFLLPTGKGKCITWDSLVPTNKGFISMIDLAEDLEVDNYKKINLKTFGLEGIEKIGHIYNNGLDDVIRIKTKKGYEIAGTKKHRLHDGNDWVYLPDLKKGKKLPLVRGSNLWNESSNDDMSNEDLKILGFRAKDKIPEFVLSSNKENICKFLSASFDIRSEIRIGKNNKIVIDYINFTERIVKQIQIILLNLGVICERERYNCIVDKKIKYKLSISDFHSIKILYENIKLSQFKKEIDTYLFQYEKLESIEKNELYYYDEIESIVREKEETYDLVIPRTHSFVANGFINHNTHMMCMMAATNVKAGHKTLFIHGEMSRGEVIGRLIPYMTDGKVTRTMVKNQELFTYKTVRKEIYKKYKGKLQIFGPEQIGTMTLYNIRSLIRKHKPKVVIIDYMQQIQGAEDYKKPVSKKLKNYCDVYDVNIICATQASDFSNYDPDGDGFPNIKHIEKCKGLANDCDWIMGAKSQYIPHIKGLTYHFVVRKTRQGSNEGICNVPYTLRPEYGWFGKSINDIRRDEDGKDDYGV